MDTDSPFIAPPKRRGRPKGSKNAVASPPLAPLNAGDGLPTESQEPLSNGELLKFAAAEPIPTMDVEALRLSQEIAARGYADAVPVERVPEGFSRDVLARIVSWYATPYEWRSPKTEVDLAVELNMTPLALRVRASMFRDGIEATQNEIRRSAQSHARLRFHEAVDGQIAAAVAGSAPAFDRVRAEAWGDEIAPLVGGANVTVNIAAVRQELMEKLG